jgi:hypothetical protein
VTPSARFQHVVDLSWQLGEHVLEFAFGDVPAKRSRRCGGDARRFGERAALG